MRRFIPYFATSTVVPRWLYRALEIWIVLEALWVTFLAIHLPPSYDAAHWDLAWVGLDVAQLVALGGVVVSGLRNRPSVVLFSMSSGVLMMVDAWFDVTTAHRGGAWPSAIAAAFEVPFAVVLFWAAFSLLPKTPLLTDRRLDD